MYVRAAYLMDTTFTQYKFVCFIPKYSIAEYCFISMSTPTFASHSADTI